MIDVDDTRDRGGVRRIAGCDLGKAAAKLVIGELDAGGTLRIERVDVVEHGSDPLGAFRRWYGEAEIAGCGALGATGLASSAIIAPALGALPEDACLEAALPLLAPEGPLNLVSVGARGYGVLTRDAAGRVQHLENEKCSAGTGETMVKIAGRFGLRIEEADRLAVQTDLEPIPITARCSVFAKSEMTHYGNQGRPAGALFRGYFGSIAATVAGLLERVRVDGPVLVIGGAARIATLVAALGERLGADVAVPEHALCFEAVGALALAAEQWRAGAIAGELPADADALLQIERRRFTVREPASRWRARVTRLTAPAALPGAATRPAVLGLDLGSTGSKAVLTSVGDGAAVLDRYDRTRGNPVDAAQRLVRAILADCTPDVRAIALTGSGREAAASVLRAAYPQLASHIVVENEIVAHATGAIACDPRGGRSLSVVEIGGQDAKFIQIVDGQIVESDMNKACSAGTGSFLEEQAVFYGIDDIADFTELAQQAERPPDLGQMCTVFVAEAAADAHAEGFSLADLFGGFQYSVIHNYLHRVMGQRTLGETIFFQGKPASGPALAWTLAAVTGREVVVPANPGAAGAWGIGLCALDKLGATALDSDDAPRFDLSRVLAAEVVERRELQCRDKRCATYCTIERTTVELAGAHTSVTSGGACPKYEIAGDRHSRKLERTAPNAFAERAALLERFVSGRSHRRPGRGAIGLPAVGACLGVLPWLAALLEGLGLEVEVLWPDRSSLQRGEALCFAYDACSPVKTAHAVVASASAVPASAAGAGSAADAGADADADAVAHVFFPKLLALSDPDGLGGKTCPVEQALPEIVREALAASGRRVEVISPVLSLEPRPMLARIAELLPTLARLGAPADKLPAALAAADLTQQRYERELADIGERTLSYGRARALPVVVVCGSLHVIHDPVINAGIPTVLRENGVLALPLDCLSISEDIDQLPSVPWADANRALRSALLARERGDVYPLLLSSFGCGPASFVEQLFTALMAGYPHTVLESDGHGGTAGYVTRVQAFLHAVRRHDRRPSRASDAQLDLLKLPPSPALDDERDSRLVVLALGDLSPLIAGTMNALGYNAVASGPTSPEVLALGRRDCSGKECLPYQLLWGAFRQEIERDESAEHERTVLMQVHGEGMCRNCMFALKDRVSLEHLGLGERVAMRIWRQEDVGWRYLPRVWSAIVGWDLLNQLRLYHLAAQRQPGAADALYRGFYDELVALVSQPAASSSLGELRDLARGWRALVRLLERASLAFAHSDAGANGANGQAPRRGELAAESHVSRTLPRVLLSGDIYLRLDAFASDDLARRLAARGLRVLLEPLSTLGDYLASEQLGELMGLSTEPLANAVTRTFMTRVRRSLYRRVAARHPWLPSIEPADVATHSAALLDRYPQGEAPVTIGSVLHSYATGACDGAVIVSPWGCGPALISESLLRHRRDVPMLFVYGDGSPIDERRLAAFAFRLHRQHASRSEHAAAVGSARGSCRSPTTRRSSR